MSGSARQLTLGAACLRGFAHTAGLLDPAYLDSLQDANGSTYLQAATAGEAGQ